MALDFNWEGYLFHDVELTFEEFVHHFGTNSGRMQKKKPEDIDLCFDLSNVDREKLEKEFPQFFDVNAIGTIHRDLQCHILHFDKTDNSLFTMLRFDRSGNPKGLVKLNISEILSSYDKK